MTSQRTPAPRRPADPPGPQPSQAGPVTRMRRPRPANPGSSATVYRAKRVYTPRRLWRDLRELLAHAGDVQVGGLQGGIPRTTSEKLMLTVTAVNECRYCSYAHTRLALRSGVTPEEVELLLGGEIGTASPFEAPALFFAQHYAATDGRPDPDLVQGLTATYGAGAAAQILAQIRMISLANLAGNTFDALLGRLRGRPSEGSRLIGEVASLALLALAFPVLGIAFLIRSRLRR
jgi:AhpD family alkylhydroperoxidase